MRVSIPICIGSCLAVVMLTWWLSTRSHDFLAAPSEAELEQVRISAAQTNPTAQGLGDALSPAAASSKERTPIPVVMAYHINRAPQLDDYLDEAKHGSQYLMELAKLLGDEHPERALTCWERVIDSTKANDRQKQQAVNAIIRLKQTTAPWNSRKENAMSLLIQIGTGPSAAKLLDPTLDETTEFLNACSSGVVNFDKKVSVGSEDMIDAGRSPVAMWVSGPEENGSTSTQVASLFIKLDEPEHHPEQVRHEVLKILREHLNQMDNFQPPPKPSEQYSTDKILEGYITRMIWMRLAESLQMNP